MSTLSKRRRMKSWMSPWLCMANNTKDVVLSVESVGTNTAIAGMETGTTTIRATSSVTFVAIDDTTSPIVEGSRVTRRNKKTILETRRMTIMERILHVRR